MLSELNSNSALIAENSLEPIEVSKTFSNNQMTDQLFFIFTF